MPTVRTSNAGAKHRVRQQAFLAIGSIVLLAAAVALFSFWWARFGRVPVRRAFEHVGPLFSFLEIWTQLFVVGAVAGCSLGGLAMRRRSPFRRLALAGLAGNAVWLAALVLLLLTA
jgi:hypothetical protein